MKSSHTPGPWIIADDQYKSFIYALNKDGSNRFYLSVRAGYLNQRSNCIKRTPSKEVQANAQLIAAAPDLLAALELYGLNYTDEELRKLAETETGMGEINPITAKREIIRRRAIAKAKGEAP